MKQDSKIDRRRFLGITSRVSATACLPTFFRDTANDHRDKSNEYIEAIIKIIDELEGWEYGDSPEKEEIENIIYAFNQIRPRNHQELTFVGPLENLWVQSPIFPFNHVISHNKTSKYRCLF
ncbi:MAG: hypothetical protein J7M06_02315 [Proteobacteria bacterium]|nr:hypothetical protein [Pseudomonadota bacterium]